MRVGRGSGTGDRWRRRSCRRQNPRRVRHRTDRRVRQRWEFDPCDPNTNTCPCANPSPIPSKFPGSTLPGAVLDPARLLVGSVSNFGAPLAAGGGRQGSFLSIDLSGADTLVVPADFDSSGDQATALGGAVQMFSANSPHWLNSVNNPAAFTAQYAGVGNPLGLSNNNGFGRIWPANAPFGLGGKGSSSILDPTGLPLKGAPNPSIGGVYVGDLTNRNVVANPAQPQVIPGALNTGGVGTALLGPSPDGTCKAVFAVVTANGAIVQEHTLKGLDGVRHGAQYVRSSAATEMLSNRPSSLASG